MGCLDLRTTRNLRTTNKGRVQVIGGGRIERRRKKKAKTKKMSLEFSESMYTEMEGFVGKR